MKKTQLQFRPSTAFGYPTGETHPRARYSDAAVAQARELRAQGQTFRAISEALRAPIPTVEGWTSGRRRTALPVRLMVQRVPGDRPVHPATTTLKAAAEVLAKAKARARS